LFEFAKSGHAMSALEMTVSTAPQSDEATAAPSLRGSGLWRPLLGLALPLALAGAWELAVRIGWSDGRLVPPPSVIGATLWELARSGELWTHMQATVLRVAAGFGLGVAAGTLLGAIAG
jgi:sulfonate transport system permease protein